MLLARIVLSFAQYPKYHSKFAAHEVFDKLKLLCKLNKLKEMTREKWHAISKVVYCTLLGNL